MALRHLERCRACRAWAEARESLVRQLRAESADRTVAPPGLVGRVLSAVQRTDRAVGRVRRPILPRLYPHLLATAASLLVVLLTAIALRGPEAGAPPLSPPGRAGPAGGLDALSELQSALAPPAAADRGSQAVADLAGGMMGRELDKLAEDAKAVSRSLLAVLPTLDQWDEFTEP